MIGLPFRVSTLSTYLLIVKVVIINFDPCRAKDESPEVGFRMLSLIQACLRKTVIDDL